MTCRNEVVAKKLSERKLLRKHALSPDLYVIRKESKKSGGNSDRKVILSSECLM